jgi:TorA maturation chaperone TorD
MDYHASAVIPAQADKEDDDLRARQWGLLARLLVSPPDADLLTALSRLDGDSTPLGQAYGALAAKAATTTVDAASHEYFELFVGVGRGELLPYASFYLTGFLNERPLAELRRDLAVMGVARAKGRHEPEDHIATLSDIMAGLAVGDFDAGVLGCGSAGQAGFFARHVEPWAAAFFDDLAVAPGADFYRPVAEIGRIFMDIESRAFALARSEGEAGARRARQTE